MDHREKEEMASSATAPKFVPFTKKPKPAPAELVLTNFPCTDRQRMEKFVDFLDGTARFIPEWEQWFLWKDNQWLQDTGGLITQAGIKYVDSLLEEVNDPERCTAAERKTAYTCALKAQSADAISSMIRLARSHPDVRASITSFDADPFLFGVQNGVINLRTGEFRAAKASDLILKRSNASYDPAAVCPDFEEFLAQILPQEGLIPFMQRAIGYTLTGVTTEQMLFFLYGTGANGKSTFIETMQKLFGDYAWKAAASMFLATKYDADQATMFARLPEKRFVIGAEVAMGAKLAESRIKDLTGGDTLNARELFCKAFQFTPTHKLWFYGNHRPGIDGNDHGIWRRMCLIPFTISIPEDKKDTTIVERLWRESSGILNWAIKGCQLWQKEGKLHRPEVVKVAVEDYREEEDLIGAFLVDQCKPEGCVTREDLYRAYTQWSDDRGMKFSFGVKNFVERIKHEPGIGQERPRIKGVPTRTWTGLSLRDASAFRKRA